MDVGDGLPKASGKSGSPAPNLHVQGRSACGSSASPGRGQPSLPQGRAQLRSLQPAKSGPHRAGPARSSAAVPGPPPAGLGVGAGGHRPANSGSGGRSAPHPLRQPQTYLQGKARLLDSGHGPEGWRPGGRSPSQRPPNIPGGAGRGQMPGGCRGPARPVAGVAGTWLSPQHQSAAAAAILPSTRCRRRRTPPQVSRMWAFPGVACAGAEDWGLLSAPPPAAGMLPAPSGPPPVVLSSAGWRASPRVAPAWRWPGDSPGLVGPGSSSPKSTHLFQSLFSN